MIAKMTCYILLITIIASLNGVAGSARSEARLSAVGEIRFATILITFYDDPDNSAYIDADPEMPPQAYQEFLFESPFSLNAFIKETSYGKTWLSGEVFGPFEIPADSPSEEDQQSCRVFDEVVAATSGTIDFSQFDVILIIYPRAKNAKGEFVNFCGFQGVSGRESVYDHIDGMQSYDIIWINGFVNLHILAHELGHLLGLGHANAWRPNPQQKWPYAYGRKLETKDPYSVMGYGSAPDYSGPAHFSASEKDTLGWFDSYNVLNIKNFGTFKVHLAPIESRSRSIQTVKIKLEKWKSYFIEFRRAIGFDAHLKNVDGLFVLRTGRGMSGYEGNRLFTSLERDRFILPVGESFIDRKNELQIKTIRMDQHGIDVEITFGVPNLVIGTPDFVWPRQVVRGDTVATPVVVENTGVADIKKSFQVVLSISGGDEHTAVISRRLSSLLKGERQYVQINWSVSNESENVKLKLIADFENEIKEANENDNVAPQPSGHWVHLKDPGDVLAETGDAHSLSSSGKNALPANYPNPFNSATTIEFKVPADGPVHLAVYDFLGRHVATLVHSRLVAGLHSVQFDGSQLASGVYLCRLQAGDHVHTRKLMLVR